MMHDILSQDAVVASMQATTKKEVLQELWRLASAATGQDDMAIFNALW